MSASLLPQRGIHSFRARSEFVGAVDFGSRDVRVIIARRDEDGTITVIGHGTAPGRGCVSQGVIQDLGAAQMALKRAISDAEKEARVRIPSLFCGINGRNVETFIREGNAKLEKETVEPRHMDEALDLASRDVLGAGKRVVSSLSAQEWYVDDMRVIDPVGIRGHVLKVRVHFARIPAVIEDNIVQCIESQKRELEDIIFLPLASSMGCLTPEDMELGVAVLDMGRSTTGLAVYRDRRILGSQVFEWGGYHLTRDVAAGMHVSFDEADDLILEYGISDEFIVQGDSREQGDASSSSKPGADAQIKLKSTVNGARTIVPRAELDMIVYERAKEMLSKVRQYVHARGLAKHLVRGVVLTGGAAGIKNCVKLGEAVFETPCRVGVPTTVEILPHAINSPEYSGAVGIVRHGFDFRAAARNGRLDARSGVASGARKLGNALRKYFF